LFNTHDPKFKLKIICNDLNQRIIKKGNINSQLFLEELS